MSPGRRFGFGVELPYLMLQAPQTNVAGIPSNLKNGWDGITLVAKYQFGIYHHYHFFNKKKLAKAIAALIFKFRWDNSLPQQQYKNNNLFYSLQASKSISAGLAFHTDTARNFRIHGHLNATFPISHETPRPAANYHFHFAYLLARLGIRDLFYPFVGIAGMHIRGGEYDGNKISPSGMSSLFFSTGLQSTWKYYPAYHTFIQLELGAQMRAYHHPAEVLLGPAFALYFGTRFYFR